MSREQDEFREVMTLFEEALTRVPEQRKSFLAIACKEATVRNRVADLLLKHDDPTGPLGEESVRKATDIEPLLSILSAHEGPRDPERVGPYHILEMLGEGGMGRVYRARQDEPVRREVALKILKAGIHGRERRARFDLERQALAWMNHPMVARIHGGGETDDGFPYFVMELVEGEPLTSYCDRRNLPPRERLILFRKVCLGVEHAHQRGIVHRDLKPSNILVADNGKALPKVIDFGIAKLFEDETPGTLTHAEQLLGTPEYMSPEQAGDIDHGVDTRTDVYSLGVVLRELLIGCNSPSEGRLPRDLTAILTRSLERHPQDRYPSVTALASDLRAYLDGDPISARTTGHWDRTKRLLIKHRRAVGAAAVALFVLVFLTVASIGFAVRSAEAQRRATESGEVVDTRYRELRQLADIAILEELEVDSEELWPAVPEAVAALESWLDRAHALSGRLDGHRTTLAELEATSRPHTEEDARRDRETHPLFSELMDLVTGRSRLEERIAERPSEAARWRERLQEVEGDIENLKKEVATRRTWQFEDEDLEWEREQLAELVARLEAFVNPAPFQGAVASVALRLEKARTIHARSVERYAAAWEEARVRIATSTVYSDVSLAPQLGLIPLGPDPESHLEEFAHVETGSVPARDDGGNLQVGEESALVLVLLPGGTFSMGADRSRDPLSLPREAPVHSVTLDPFFLAKYEMTQGQWLRLTGEHPSYYRPSRWQVTLLHPVETVNFEECAHALARIGLVIPTEAQWEYGARGGTTTPWWTGKVRETLVGAANLADRAARNAGAPYVEAIADWPDLDDGFSDHGPVGSSSANPFGLHEVHGNVWEWVRGRLVSYRVPPQPGDGERDGSYTEAMPTGVVRGGAFDGTSFLARVSHRDPSPLDARFNSLGIRPARELRTE